MYKQKYKEGQQIHKDISNRMRKKTDGFQSVRDFRNQAVRIK